MSLAAGTHTTTIMAMDTKGTEIDHTTVSYTVASAKSNGTSITTPAPGSSVSGAVTVNAAAAEAVTVSETQVWDNGVKLGSYSGGAVSQSYDLEPGTHTLTVLTLDSSSNVIDHGTVIYSVDGGTASQ
jgi:hypothetical protein